MATNRTIPKNIQELITKGELNDSEWRTILTYFGNNASPQELDQLISNPDMAAQIQNILTSMATDPERIQSIKAGKTASAIQSGLNVLLNIRDIAESGKQIRMSEKELARIRKPSRPERQRPSEALRRAITDAQGDRISDAPIAAAREGIREGYQTDIGTARQASGGQSGTYGALTQLAANRRRKSVNDLLPLVAQLRERQTTRLDGLLGMDIGERQSIANQAQRQHYLDLNQYNTETQAAAALGAQGRSNLRNSMYNTLEGAAPIIKGLTNLGYKSFNPKLKQPTTYTGDPGWDAYTEYVNNSLAYGNNYRNS